MEFLGGHGNVPRIDWTFYYPENPPHITPSQQWSHRPVDSTKCYPKQCHPPNAKRSCTLLTPTAPQHIATTLTATNHPPKHMCTKRKNQTLGTKTKGLSPLKPSPLTPLVTQRPIPKSVTPPNPTQWEPPCTQTQYPNSRFT